MAIKTVKNLGKFGAKYVYTVVGTISLLTFGLFYKKQRDYMHKLAGDFGWNKKSETFPTILPIWDPAELLASYPITLNEAEGNPGNVSLLELTVICALIKKYQPKKIFEFGTFDGRTTLNMAANSDADAKIYTLDLPPDSAVEFSKSHAGDDSKFAGKINSGYKFKNSLQAKKIEQLYGDSSKFDYSKFAKSIDFSFVDGGHSYFFVDSDTKNALAMKSANGIIAWHDYRENCEGVTSVLNALYHSGGQFKNLRRVKGTNLAVLLPN